jgi:hypothetical protein
MPLCNDIIKNRIIRFKLTSAEQASKAGQLLGDVPGVHHIEVKDQHRLQISYSVEELTLQMIESALREVGFDLQNDMISNLKRAVFSYCEEALRASIGVEHHTHDNLPSISLKHPSLQDPRPHNWRKFV